MLMTLYCQLTVFLKRLNILFMKSFENYRNKEFVGVAEFAQAVKEILQSTAIEQSREVVAQFPNERTIRYYLSEGLLPPAAYSEGTASVFTYLHLMTLIVIKHLQSQGLPIRIIKRIITNRNITELKKLLSEPVTTTTDVNEARLAELRGEDVVVIRDRDEIREILKSSLGKSGGTGVEPQIWERYPISAEIELHISQNSGLNKKEKRKLARDVEGLLLSNSSS